MTGLGVLNKHAVLAVHRHEELRFGQGQHQLLVLLEAVTGHMDAFALAVNDLGPKHHQAVDRVDHGNRVSRDRAGGEDDRVAGLHLHLGMLPTGDAAQSGQRLTLTAGHQQQRLAIGHIIDLLDRHEQIIRSTHVAELAGLGDHVEHGTPEQTNLAAVLESQFEDHRNPVDRTGEGGDDHSPLGTGHVAIEVGEHRTLRRAETRHLCVG